MPLASPLTRLYAYAVVPRLQEGIPGGPIDLSPGIETALKDSYEKARLDKALPISFMLDTTSRTSDMRDLLLRTVFGRAQDADDAASIMARRLASVMDARSKAALLVLSVAELESSERRQVVLWTFPRDEAFKLVPSQSAIELLDDIFSRSSMLRKAAVFWGRNLRTDFLTGRVLDYQANTTDRFVADFWIREFLGAQLQISSDEGTRMFATALRSANTKLDGDVDAQEQLHSAVAAVRHTPQQRLSLEAFANTYLQGRVRDVFIDVAPSHEAVTGLFDFDREQFDRLLQFRVFQLETGVSVTAPFGEIGRSVTMDDAPDGRLLEVKGRIANEKMTARRG